jgi:hypothetical protein
MQKSKPLLSIVSEIISLEQILLENEGEATATFDAYFDLNEDNLLEKIDAYAYAIDRLESTYEFFKKKEAEAKEAKKKIENKVDDLKARLKVAAKVLNRSELKGHEYIYKISKMQPKAVITNKDILPTTFIKEKIVFEVDNEMILNTLKNGEVIEGAELQEVVALRRSLNKE